MGLQCRNGWYYFYKRVPTHVNGYDSRNYVRISLKTRDKFDAQKKSLVYEEEYTKFWQDLVQKDIKANEADYKRAIAIAHTHGFAYKNAIDIAKTSSYKEILERVELSSAPKSTTPVKQALMGTVDAPTILLSDCKEEFWKHCSDRFTNKSEHQINKYKTPRERSMTDFIAVIGDKDLKQIVRQDILDFHDYLMSQISHGMNADTANKKVRHVKDILRTVSNAKQIEFDEDVLFARTRFKLIKTSRPPFEAEFVQDTLLPSLSGLNDDARMMVFAMADTGAREAELIGLDKNDIILDAPIPYIWIRAKEKRSLKTEHSERRIPLVGTALYAFQQMPSGFNRYKEADSISNLINKYFDNNNLRPTNKHSLYSLRHTFKDRLRDIGAPEEVIDQLMGHRTNKPKYGRGHKLETTHEWIQKIAYTVHKSI